MVHLNDIKKAITRLLSQAFPEFHIFSEDISQVEAENGTAFPLLHVQLDLQGSELAMGGDTKDKSILVDITFMEGKKSSSRTMYEVQEKLELAIGTGFYCGNRYLHVETMNGSTADDLLHVTFPVMFNDAMPGNREDHQLFGELEIRI